MLSDHPSTLISQVCCQHLQWPTLRSPLLVFDVFGYCPLFLWEIKDVLVSVSVDLEAAPADEDVYNGS